MPLSKKLQEIVDKISDIREKLLASISGLSESQLNQKPNNNGWSIGDVVHHLALTDEANSKLMWNFLKRARAENLPSDPSPDGSELHSVDDIWARMREPRFQAPEFVAPKSDLPVDESLTRLKASRARMLDTVEQLGGFDLSRLTFPHPFAGELNAYQWLLIAGGHESRHTAQIERIKAQQEQQAKA